MRSWMGAGILKVAANRAQAPAALVQSSTNGVQSVVAQLEIELENWDEDILDDGVAVQPMRRYGI